MLRKTPRAPTQPVVAEEEIDPGLLDHIPDVSASVGEGVGLETQNEGEAESPPPTEFQALLANLHEEMQQLVADGFGKIEANVGGLFVDLEQRLADANAQVEDLRLQNERYERAFRSLKELTRDIE